MKKICKNCLFHSDSKIPQFVLCEVNRNGYKQRLVKQETDTCSDCEVDGVDQG